MKIVDAIILSAFAITISLGANTTSQTLVLTTTEPQYSIDYYVENVDTDAPNIVITQKMVGFDTSTWASAPLGTKGVWMGIGFGNTVMTNTDIVLCALPFTNQDTDSFDCKDSNAPELSQG